MPSRSMTARWVAALPAAASLLLAAGPSPAFADDHTYTVELRQQLPRTATTDDGGVPQKAANQCSGIPEGQDGWHFVLPGNSTDFVELTVTFEPGGQKVVTDFGPPSDKHAYVASLPGAKLTSAVAEVEGGDLELFNLSHTCPSSVTAPSGQATEAPGAEPSEEVSDELCEEVSPENSGGACKEPSGKPCDEASSEMSGEPCEEASAKPEDEASDQPAPAASPNGIGGGDLAATGAGSAIGLSVAAALMLGTGGYLVMRRRKAAAQQD
ncbi:LPXTG cell wall anchor domain-containing protein [Streptomyces sp. 7N604]|uniref:LPXTG cell wall anchor domain-containing protein n=1 Tax=Streptomyces sp. 7N604 TaxID=3457415 RepID=UPI003FD3412F